MPGKTGSREWTATFGNAFTLNSGGGNMALNNATTLNAALTANAGTGTLTFGGTVDGANNLTATAGTFSFVSDLGGMTALGAVNLTSTNSLTLPSVAASSIVAQTTGASADVSIPSGKTLTASGSDTAITLASGRNFINNAGSGAISTPSGRWLVYSTNPANDTVGGLASNFRLFFCTYGSSCPSIPGTGNGFLYSSSVPLTTNQQTIITRSPLPQDSQSADVSEYSDRYQGLPVSSESVTRPRSLPSSAAPRIQVDPELQDTLGLPEEL